MDPVTHGLTGALIAEAGIVQRLGKRSRWIIAGSAMFPDIDILYRFKSLPVYIANHRGITHSFAGVIISGILIGAVLGRLDEERRYLAWIAACWVALFSHQVLDLITSYGTVVLYPFSQTRFFFDWVFILDLFLTAILLLFLILARTKPERAVSRARWGLIAATGYIAFCAFNHTLALHQLKSSAESNQIQYTQIAAIPQPLLPFRWSGILDDGTHYYQSIFYSISKPGPDFKVFNKTTGSFFEQRARETELGALYDWFARYPVITERTEGHFHIVEFTDLRFYIKLHTWMVRKPFVLRIKMDDQGNIVESRFSRL